MFGSILGSWICPVVFKQYIQWSSFNPDTTVRGTHYRLNIFHTNHHWWFIRTIVVLFEIRKYRCYKKVEANPALWLSAVSQSRVRDTFCSYGVMELCTKGLGSSVHALKARGVSLACVRTCVVVAEERPRIALTTSFSKLFSALGLSPRAVSTSFGCRVNTAICLQVRTFLSFFLSTFLFFFRV